MAEKHDDERCANCGACKHCGSPRIQFVPMPYPVYPTYMPWYPRPYGTYFPNYQWSNATAVSPQLSGGTISASGTGMPNTFNARLGAAS